MNKYNENKLFSSDKRWQVYAVRRNGSTGHKYIVHHAVSKHRDRKYDLKPHPLRVLWLLLLLLLYHKRYNGTKT